MQRQNESKHIDHLPQSFPSGEVYPLDDIRLHWLKVASSKDLHYDLAQMTCFKSFISSSSSHQEAEIQSQALQVVRQRY